MLLKYLYIDFKQQYVKRLKLDNKKRLYIFFIEKQSVGNENRGCWGRGVIMNGIKFVESIVKFCFI